MKILFNTEETETYTLLRFKLPVLLSPEDLKTMTPPEPVAHKGVILSGRGPVWLYGFLVHHYHPTKWVATHAPRLQGAVVVESHVLEMEVGTVVPLNPSTLTF